MIESRNCIGVYYILPGETVRGQTVRKPGWYYFLAGDLAGGPLETEALAELELAANTQARLYREKNKETK